MANRLVLGLSLGFVLHPFFAVAAGLYLALYVAYSLALKHVASGLEKVFARSLRRTIV